MKSLLAYILLSVCICLCWVSCTHKSQIITTPVADTTGYPDSVKAIVISNCAIAGCHNQASYHNAADLLLTTWTHMFQGSAYGAEVVAYRALYSPLLYYVNAYDSSDPIANDPGHILKPITLQQYHTLKNWIASGAPDRNGNIPFATNADTRQKIYLAMNSGCNQVAVIDAQSRLVMRYIPVGDELDGAEHDVEVSGDGAYAYVSVFSGRYVQKIDTRADTVIATANLGSTTAGGAIGNWSILYLSPMDTALMVSGFEPPAQGAMVSVNTTSMQVNAPMSIDAVNGNTGDFAYPHGIGSNATWDTFFTALQYGNVVNKYTFKPHYSVKHIPIKGNAATYATLPGTPDPHQIEMAPDHSKYFVTCQNSNEVRVLDAHTDAVIDSIAVGAYPQEMATCVSKNYLFVVCMRDGTNPNPGSTGSVYVIDLTTHSIVKVIYGDFNQPHDIAVDEKDGLLFIVSTNQGGSAHHLSVCSGANGWYSVYDLNTLQPADNKRYEVLVFPYAAAARF